MARRELEDALREAGEDRSHTARLRRLLAAELRRSARELELARSGYEEPVTVAVAPGVVAVTPVAVAWRVDPAAVPRRAARLAELLVDVLGEPEAGDQDGHLALAAAGDAAETAELFDLAVLDVDRLKARAVLVPAAVLEVSDLRPLPRAGGESAVPPPHEDPEPARRIARRMLLTLRGKGKWGGYHTEVTNLARGFQGEWDLAEAVGEALVAAGLLIEKPSVGQRHVSLNPRRKREIDHLIDAAELPPGLTLPTVGR